MYSLIGDQLLSSEIGFKYVGEQHHAWCLYSILFELFDCSLDTFQLQLPEPKASICDAGGHIFIVDCKHVQKVLAVDTINFHFVRNFMKSFTDVID
mmetsp:Transcript_68240/g.110738  ORF Transcript_68240/g.110738 Transcript_68240/m.110738 type:complete len:96 (+) Transcript_68240:83-370(+)